MHERQSVLLLQRNVFFRVDICVSTLSLVWKVKHTRPRPALLYFIYDRFPLQPVLCCLYWGLQSHVDGKGKMHTHFPWLFSQAFKSYALRVYTIRVLYPHLIAMHHEVVCGDQGFENHHPAGIAGPLHQRVGHLGDVDIGLLGGLDQVWDAQRRRRNRRSDAE